MVFIARTTRKLQQRMAKFHNCDSEEKMAAVNEAYANVKELLQMASIDTWTCSARDSVLVLTDLLCTGHAGITGGALQQKDDFFLAVAFRIDILCS